MINGQLNMTSAQTVMQLVAQQPTGSVAAKTADVTQDDGDFAGLLSDIQLQVKEKGLTVSEQGEQSQVRIGKDHFALDAAAEEPPADLLARLQELPHITDASDHAVPRSDDPKKTDDCSDDVPLRSEPSDVTLQMAMAAYSPPGRTPDVNIPTSLPVDTLQKVASVIEQPAAVVATPPVELQANHVTAKPLPTTSVQAAEKPTIKLSVPFAEELQQHYQPETASLPADDRKQLGAIKAKSASAIPVRPEQPLKPNSQAITSTPPATVEAPLVVQAPPAAVQPAVAASPVPANLPQAVLSDRMPDVNKPAPLPVDRLQNAAPVTDQPALFSHSPDKIQVEQAAAEPAQAPVTLAAITATVHAPDETIAPLETRNPDLPKIPAEKTAAITPQSEPPSVHPVEPEPVLSPESELEMYLSQARPITARAAAAPASADNHSAALVQELRGSRPRLSPEQQIDKVRAGNEQNDVKEMAPSSQSVAPAGESKLGSDTSRGSDSNQGETDAVPDNQMLAQDMRGQVRTEHQRVAALAAKTVPTEAVRQDVSEQVMLQVKDRLVQHDVKPGNQQITLTLSPDTLGELKMNLNLQGQKLSVEIVAENRTVRDAILQHTDALKESLARQNITMESFDVTTGGKGSGNQGQNQSAWRELAKQQQQQHQWASPRGYQTAQADVPSGQTAYQRPQGHTMLDIHY